MKNNRRLLAEAKAATRGTVSSVIEAVVVKATYAMIESATDTFTQDGVRAAVHIMPGIATYTTTYRAIDSAIGAEARKGTSK